ncbi:DUF3540 domain-containing protein (plasmid) [Burkholderia sp. FERM BP-3421]|nr:DUF3540 domain-containing protein [Burkholderia sp. FERM BP-3421]WDD90516.1 DUF3540 domain-containing protein [Burkholderia sp. FERM BP-3421]
MIETRMVRERQVESSEDEMPEPMRTLLKRSAAPFSPGAAGRMSIGRVTGAESDGLWRIVVEPGCALYARAAVSCIVRPQADDLVQLYQAADGCWVLAILERRGDAADVVLDFGAAEVLLQAQDVRVQARDRLGLEAAQLSSRAEVITEAAAERHAHVSGTDATHAGNTFVHTEGHLGMHAQSAVVTAEALLKMDAGQIHVG